MKTTVLRITGFLLALALTLGAADGALRFKYADGIYNVEKYYELEKNTVDVLVLGTSHAYESINTGALWDGYGIASYVLGGSVQPVWNTFYYLKEALKTQTPSLIILEAFGLAQDSEEVDDSRIIKNTYGLRWNRNRIDAINISAPEEKRRDILLAYTQYHTRYRELGPNDFLKDQGMPVYQSFKGFLCNMETAPYPQPEVEGITARIPLLPKVETYYRDILALAEAQGIPVLVLVGPYARISEEQQQRYNTAGDIASECGAAFLNTNLLTDEIGLDFQTDAADGQHLNDRGNIKFARYLGAWLKEHYDLPDRRGDARYGSWQENADYIRGVIADQQFVRAADQETAARQALGPDHLAFVSVDGTCNTADPALQDLFAVMGIPADGSAGIWYWANGKLKWFTGSDTAELYQRLHNSDICLRRSVDENGVWKNEVIFDRTVCAKVRNGVNITVYSTVSESVVATIGFDADNDYAMV